MKVKLLKKLRGIGKNKITIHSITNTNGTITGMSYGFDEDEYKNLFNLGDTADDVRNKAARIYIEGYLTKNKEDEKL